MTPIALHDGAGHTAMLISRPISTFEAEYYLMTAGGPKRLDVPLESNPSALVAGRLLFTLQQDWTAGGSTFAKGSLVSVDLGGRDDRSAASQTVARLRSGPSRDAGERGSDELARSSSSPTRTFAGARGSTRRCRTAGRSSASTCPTIRRSSSTTPTSAARARTSRPRASSRRRRCGTSIRGRRRRRAHAEVAGAFRRLHRRGRAARGDVERRHAGFRTSSCIRRT